MDRLKIWKSCCCSCGYIIAHRHHELLSELIDINTPPIFRTGIEEQWDGHYSCNYWRGVVEENGRLCPVWLDRWRHHQRRGGGGWGSTARWAASQVQGKPITDIWFYRWVGKTHVWTEQSAHDEVEGKRRDGFHPGYWWRVKRLYLLVYKGDWMLEWKWKGMIRSIHLHCPLKTTYWKPEVIVYARCLRGLGPWAPSAFRACRRLGPPKVRGQDHWYIQSDMCIFRLVLLLQIDRCFIMPDKIWDVKQVVNSGLGLLSHEDDHSVWNKFPVAVGM